MSSIRQRVRRGIHWEEHQGEEEVEVKLERRNIRYNTNEIEEVVHIREKQ